MGRMGLLQLVSLDHYSFLSKVTSIEKDLVVGWQQLHQAHSPHQCVCIPQDEEEDNDSVEVEAERVGPGEHEEVVGLGSITVVPKPVK